MARSLLHRWRGGLRASPTPGGRLRRGLIWTALLTVLGVSVVVAVPGLGEVQARLHDAAPGWLFLAGGLELMSCLGFVVTFRFVFPLVSLRLANQIAWTEMAFGAVVPLGGAGGMTVGAWILHEKGIALRLVAMRSGVLFLLTSAINVIVLAASGLGLGTGLLSGPHRLTLGLLPAAVALAVFAVVVTADRWSPRTDPHSRISRWITSTTATVRMTRALLLSGDWRLLGAFAYLLFDIAVLWACFRAFGVDPPLAALLMGYQIGYLANLVPVPGSIGALEGGLTGALLLYGTPPAPTFAAVLVYHAIALWLPTIGGTIAFVTLRGTLHKPLPSAVRARIGRAAAASEAGRSRVVVGGRGRR
jgi:uncharacterized membrane protein YbhN (UPF0104 family)